MATKAQGSRTQDPMDRRTALEYALGSTMRNVEEMWKTPGCDYQSLASFLRAGSIVADMIAELPKSKED